MCTVHRNTGPPNETEERNICRPVGRHSNTTTNQTTSKEIALVKILTYVGRGRRDANYCYDFSYPGPYKRGTPSAAVDPASRPGQRKCKKARQTYTHTHTHTHAGDFAHTYEKSGGGGPSEKEEEEEGRMCSRKGEMSALPPRLLFLCATVGKGGGKGAEGKVHPTQTAAGGSYSVAVRRRCTYLWARAVAGGPGL